MKKSEEVDTQDKETKLKNEYCSINTQPVKYDEYHIYLNNNIDKAYRYNEFLEVLRKASDDDEIFVHLNSDGGYIDTAIQIINAMKTCEAKITTIMEGATHSCASLIFLQGNKKKVLEHSYMLCHYYSGALWGKGQELEAQSAFDKKFLKQFFRNIYKGFLTKKEIEELIKGKDFWFDAKEVKKRLKLK